MGARVAHTYPRQRLADLGEVAGRHEDLANDPGNRCFDLHIDLVGGDLADRLTLGDLVPDLYQPCRDGSLLDRDAQTRNENIGLTKQQRNTLTFVGGFAN
jgi:hypothetical protein